MATTAGTLSQVSVGARVASLLSAAATAGVAPYTYQWYKSTTTGFTPGTGNIISGATSLALSDTGLTPSTNYFYKVVAADSTGTPILGTSAQLAVSTISEQPSQNAFNEAPFLGMLDQKMGGTSGSVISVQIAAGQAAMVAGQAVKFTTTANGVPVVAACVLEADVTAGFLVYDIKSQSFAAGAYAEMALAGSVMFLRAVAAISRGAQITIFPAAISGGTIGGVITAVSTKPIVGWSMDTVNSGDLVRIFLSTPAYVVA